MFLSLRDWLRIIRQEPMRYFIFDFNVIFLPAAMKWPFPR
jgi:hypothetical protein